MHSVHFIVFFCLAISGSKIYKPNATSAAKDKDALQDSTTVGYWKAKAVLAEKEAKNFQQLAEKSASEARQQKRMAEKSAMDAANQLKRCQESAKTIADLNKLIDTQKKQLEDCKK